MFKNTNDSNITKIINIEIDFSTSSQFVEPTKQHDQEFDHEENKELNVKSTGDTQINLCWDDVENEIEALYNHMVDLAYAEDTPQNELVREEVWHNDLILKYFNFEKYKADLINQGWMIIQSERGFAFHKSEQKIINALKGK